MRIELIPVSPGDAARFAALQREAFLPLLQRYQDSGNPAHETAEVIREKIDDAGLDVCFILADGQIAGGLMVRHKEEGRHRLTRIFVSPGMQRKGIAAGAMQMAEARHPDATRWELDTIAQERGNCRLYRRMGYHWTGHATLIHPRMTLIDFVKPMPRDAQ